MTSIGRISLAAFLVSMAAAPSAGAQPVEPATLAAAQVLHDEAVAALDRRDFAEACPKLERVVQMIPQGIGARLSLAECYEGFGKLASAWATYVAVDQAAGKAGQRDRQQLAARKSAELRPKLARMTLIVPDAVRALPGLKIRRGRTVIEPAQWGTSVPVDSGGHLISVTATGKRRWERSITIEKDGASITVEVPAPEDDRPTRLTPPSRSVEREDGLRAPALPAIITFGVAGAALGLGAITGAMSSSTVDELEQQCPNKTCSGDSADAYSSARTAATVSTICFMVGGLATAGGVMLLVMDVGREEPVTTGLALGPGWLAAKGSF